jgi:hypothetical protein
MCITSLGIFGFLTSAYQTHSAKVGTFDTKIETLAREKESVDKSTLELADRIKALSELRVEQEQRVKDAGNLKSPREQAYKAINQANEEMQQKEAQLSQARERSVSIDKEIGELKIVLNTTTDVGSFKFIASALNTSVDAAVQYFIFALIAVFDPLAVALVLCWNKLIDERAKKKKQAEDEHLQSLGTLADSFVTAKREPITQEVPVDLVSHTPIAEVPDKDLPSHPDFQAMTAGEKKVELWRRKKSSGDNNSIITNG